MSIVGFSGQSPRFSPNSLPGLVQWLDATESTSLVFSGSNVIQWKDKSGSYNHVFQNGSSNVPTYGRTLLNGMPALDFTNSSGLWSSNVSKSSNVTFFGVVMLKTTAAAWGTIWGHFSSGRHDDDVQLRRVQSSSFINWHTYNDNNIVQLSQFVDVPILFSCTMSGGTNMSMWTFTTTPASVSGTMGLSWQAGSAPIWIGRSDTNESINAYISEILYYQTVLSTPQRQLVEGYLGQKWGLIGVTGHPYRYVAPGILPTSIPGCSFWLDASDTTSMTLTGSNLTQWRDKSSNAYVGTAQGSPVLATVTGAQSVTFNGSSQYIDFGNVGNFGTNPLHIFTVCTLNNTSPNYIVAKTRYASSQYRWNFGRESGTLGGTVQTEATGAGFGTSTGVTDSSTNRRLLGYSWDRSSTNLFINGRVVASTPLINTSNVTQTNNLLIGAVNNSSGGVPPQTGFLLNGSINEIVMVYASLTALQRQQIEGYLARKWGLASDLPEPSSYYAGASIPLRDFTPTDIDGLTLWLDGADRSTLTLSGSNVTQWTDKSSLENTYTQSTAGNRPTYEVDPVLGVSGLKFTRGNGTHLTPVDTTKLSFNTSTWTTFYVIRLSDPAEAGVQTIWRGQTAGGWNRYYGNWSFWILTSDVQASQAISNIVGIYTSVVSAGTQQVLHNGVQLGSGSRTTSTMSDWITIGGHGSGEGMTGYLFEFLIYSTPLTDAQREQVENYLAAKWGLRGRMGGTAHPFRYGPTSLLPTQMSGLALWLDAADTTTITYASGSNISGWADKSGGGNNMSTNTGANYPTYTSNALNGLGVVTFNGAAGMIGNYGPAASNTPHTLFAVTRPSALTAWHCVVSVSAYPNSGTTNIGLLTTSYSSYNWYLGALYGGNDGNFSNSLVASTSRTDIVAGTWRPSLVSNTINGTTYASSTETPSALVSKASGGKTTIGGFWYTYDNYYRNFFSGYIAEILIFSNALTTTERQVVEGYLAWKWGVFPNLQGVTSNYGRLGRALTPVFTPLQVSGMMLWLDAAERSTLTLSGSNVTAWRDKSALNNHATAITAPVLSNSNIYFNGSASFSLPDGTFPAGNSSYHYFVVFTCMTDFDYFGLLGGGAADVNRVTSLRGAPGKTVYCYWYFNDIQSGGSFTNNTPSIAQTWYTSGGTRSITLNFGGSNTDTPGTRNQAPTSNYVGRAFAPDYMTGFIHEVIVYNSALTTTQRQAMEGYLAWKWGMTSSLPSNHPFKRTKP